MVGVYDAPASIYQSQSTSEPLEVAATGRSTPASTSPASASQQPRMPMSQQQAEGSSTDSYGSEQSASESTSSTSESGEGFDTKGLAWLTKLRKHELGTSQALADRFFSLPADESSRLTVERIRMKVLEERNKHSEVGNGRCQGTMFPFIIEQTKLWHKGRLLQPARKWIRSSPLGAGTVVLLLPPNAGESLVDRRSEDFGWVGELKSDGKEAKAKRQLLLSLKMVVTNPGRLFAYGFTLVGDKLVLYLASPSGIITTPAVDIDKDVTPLINMIYHMTHSTRAELGELFTFDTTTEETPWRSNDLIQKSDELAGDLVASLRMDRVDGCGTLNKDEHIESLVLSVVLHQRDSLVDRGTSVFQATLQVKGRDPEQVAVKIAFLPPARAENERGALSAISAAPPKEREGLLSPLAVFSSSKAVLGTPYIDLSTLDNADELARVAQLIILPLCERLIPSSRSASRFPTGSEVKKIVQDAIRGYRCLLLLGWIHRDLSLTNIMIIRLNGTLRGVLTDMDRVTACDKVTKVPLPASAQTGQLIGTRLFMSGILLSVQAGEHPLHDPRYDLESFYWVLLVLVMGWNADGTVEADGRLTINLWHTFTASTLANMRTSYLLPASIRSLNLDTRGWLAVRPLFDRLCQLARKVDDSRGVDVETRSVALQQIDLDQTFQELLEC